MIASVRVSVLEATGRPLAQFETDNALVRSGTRVSEWSDAFSQRARLLLRD